MPDLGLFILSAALLQYLPFHRGGPFLPVFYLAAPWALALGFAGRRFAMTAGVVALSSLALGLLTSGNGNPPWLLAWISPLPMVLLAVEPMRRRTRLGAAWLASTIGFMLGCLWLRYLSWAEVVLVGMYLGLYGLLAVAGIRLLHVRARLPLVFAVPAAAVAAEALRMHVFGGLPLLRLGEALVPWTAGIQIADLGGTPALTFLAATVAGAVAGPAIRLRRGEPAGAVLRSRETLLPAAGAILLVASAGIYGRLRMADIAGRTTPGPVLLTVQANIAQEVKNIPKDDEAYQERCLQMVKGHLDLAVPNARGADLVVWPETMFPWYLLFDTAKGAYPDPAGTGPETLGGPGWENFREVLKMTGVPSLIGAAYVEPGRGADDSRWDPLAVTARNAAILAHPDGRLGPRYDKRTLVPFFETFPFYGKSETFDAITSRIAGVRREPLTPGAAPVVMALGPHRFAVSICYEIAFPDLARADVQAGAGLIVNLSNDGWFEETEELDLMLDQAVLRAVETRAGVVRATNTGISAFIAPTGEIRKSVKDDKGRRRRVPGSIKRAAEVGPGDSGYVRNGDVFSWTVTAFAAFGSLLGFRRRSGTAGN